MKYLLYLFLIIAIYLLPACSLLLTDPLEYPADQSVEIEEDMQNIDQFMAYPNINSQPNDMFTGNQTYIDQMTLDEMQNDQSAMLDTLDMDLLDQSL